MASLPLLSSRDGVEVVAALLGHARAAPSDAGNVRILDSIFNEVVDSLRMGLPLRAEIEAGAAAVASLLNALHDKADIVSTPNVLSAPNGLQTQKRQEGRESSEHPVQSQAIRYSHLPADRAGRATFTGTTIGLLPSSVPDQHAGRQRHSHLSQPHPSQLLDSTSQPQVQAVPQNLQQSFQSTISNGRQPSFTSILPAGLPYSNCGAAHQLAPNAVPATNLVSEARPARRPPRKKRYHDAVPSTHCHICCRPSTAVPMAVCSNIKEGTCRKVVCNRCITDNGWNWEEASSESSRWICPHCTDSCTKVPRAQCWVYMRTNSRRRMNGLRKKARTVSDVGVSNALGVSGPPLTAPAAVPAPVHPNATSAFHSQVSTGVPAGEYHGPRQANTFTAGSVQVPSRDLPNGGTADQTLRSTERNVESRNETKG